MSFVSRSRNVSPTATGILQLCAGMLIIPILDVFAKLLGGRLDPVEVTLMRFIMQACLMAPFVMQGKGAAEGLAIFDTNTKKLCINISS